MTASSLLGWLIGPIANRDGQATGVQAITAEGQAEAAAAGLESGLTGRRPPEAPRAILEERVGQKVLHAWLQNQHQTLLPLALNLRTLGPDQKALLMRAMAVAVGAGSPMPPGRRERLNGWLTSMGGSEADRLTFARALAHPPPLSTLLTDAAAAKLGPAVYAISVAALDQSDEVNTLYLDYLAARLQLPVTVIRSAGRRYRI